MSRYKVAPHRYAYASADGTLVSGEHKGGSVDTTKLDSAQLEWLNRFAVPMGLATPTTDEESK